MIDMLPEINEISKRRKLLGLTQKELAQLTMTSQSLIAKLESGKINPSYGIVRNIFTVMNSMEKKKEDEVNAKKLLHKRVYSVSKTDSVHSIARLMKRYEISQLPVLDSGTIIGSITERTIVDLMSKRRQGVEKLKAFDVMDEPFPTIHENTPLASISSLLSHNSAVIVTSKGRIAGIITKADLVKLIK